MSQHITTLVAEIDSSRQALQRNKEVFEAEANPIKRIERSWSAHKGLFIGIGVAAAGGLALLLALRRRTEPVIPPGYVVVTETPPPKRWWSVLKFAASLAQPALAAWMKSKPGDEPVFRR